SATGQRWGNPIYNWKALRENDYDFWFDRIHYSEKLYDILRIDHFRAFDTYWQFDAHEETAMNGEWIENTGLEFFTKFFDKYPNSRIIAEDLGDLRPEVLELRDHFNLRGMRILEFAMFAESKTHEIAYVGTHDNEALRTWYSKLEKPEKTEVRKFIRKKYPELDVLNGILKYAFNLNSDYIILSVVDILLDHRRINLPGTVGSPNWEYKISSFRALSRRLRTVNKGLRDKK
ncbi:MAG: 4-alpha-glucanotransferase, partial [Erysipelotrichaceae bacterium]|nr:4-alpha-glucanotransferase [Erysipelotrichaceae bacterium]